MRRVICALALSVLIGLLHQVSSAAPAVAAEPEICSLNPTGLNCAPTFPAPELLNPGALSAASPEQAAALRRLSDRAVELTLENHQLPASDRSAVMSWGRAHAQAELFGLIVVAAKKAESERTADEQLAVDWMAGLVALQSLVDAQEAGEQYVRWAGLSVDHYRDLVATDPSKAELETFLSGTITPYNTLDTSQATTGYCVYEPPEPYEDDYTGRTHQTCFTPCSSVFCSLPTPSYDEFVKWGAAAAAAKRLKSAGYYTSAAEIAAATKFTAAAIAVTAAIGIATWIATSTTFFWGTTTTIAATLFAYTAADVTVVGASGAIAGAASSGGAAATAIGGTVAVVILAIVIAVLQGIHVADEAALPGKLAKFITEADNLSDLGGLLSTTEGATTVYSLFVGATLPRPRTDMTCDNSLIPPTAYTDTPGWTNIFLPLGDGVQEVQISSVPCLNPSDIPAPQATDPSFVVTHPDGTTTRTQQISLVDVDADTGATTTTATARVHGHWFITQAVGSTTQWQDLRLNYTGWDGVERRAWLVTADEGGQIFVGFDADLTTAIDPDTCEAQGLCWFSEEIEYLGPDGAHLSASLEPYQPPATTPVVTTQTPVEASPVAFDANGFAPAGAALPVTWQWRFQRDVCNIPCVTVTDPGGPFGGPTFGPSYGDPVSGKVVTHSWQTSGTFHVQLTATDAAGQQAVTEFPVRVTTIPPDLQIPSPYGVTEPGEPATIEAVIRHAGLQDAERVDINWGDGSPIDREKAGPNTIPVIGNPITFTSDGLTFTISARHAYPGPGTYHGTISVVDNGGGTDVDKFQHVVTKYHQTIDLPDLDDRHYGDAVELDAAGGGSGNPVTLTAGPAGVCQVDAEAGDTLAMLGVGECTVIADQAGNDRYEAGHASETFTVHPAALTIKGFSAGITYGANLPTFFASFEGLVNGDTMSEVSDAVGLTVTGPPAGSLPGDYPVVVSGGTTPNYDITYVNGTLTIAKRLLTVTADDQTRAYGAGPPTYTAQVQGLLAGDSADGVDLQFQGAAAGADVGTYPITVSVDAPPDLTAKYTIRRVGANEKVTPAPLTVTADDATKVYGADDPAFTADVDGLVNGDTRTDLPGLEVLGAPTGSDVGSYAVTASGITNDNYDITYLDGTETITQAPLTISADDKTKVYGADDPTYTASFKGLVNSDTRDEVTGLVVAGPGTGVGVGSYPIVVAGATNPNYAITHVYGTQQVTPAELEITADDKTRTYGGPDPELTASVEGLVNGDTRSDLTGLTLRGAPSTSGVGTYPIVASGIDNPNYDIDYIDGIETITQAPLRITAEDKSKVYGAADPAFTASFDGLVNGDSRSAITGLTLSGAASGSDVGTYPIVASGAANPNYEISYRDGTETITPASLRITAEDKTVASGNVATYSWRGSGWVNGDADATLAQPGRTSPTCTATVNGAAASATTAPGTYAGAITCTGASDDNYTITYAGGRLTVDPVITLAQTGLPATLPRTVTLDGTSTDLPVLARQVAYGSAHRYQFPAYVPDSTGVLYVTVTPGFSGPVVTNLASTATYRTVQSVIAAGVAARTIDPTQVSKLTVGWEAVEKQLKAGKLPAARSALSNFAASVRAQSGKKIAKAAADDLVAMAQAVYTSTGGKGTV